MSVQDKLEHILKNIHLLFSNSEPYEGSEEKIIVEKQKVFDLLEQLNLAVYEMMDQYEVTAQKHELAERRCEKRGEEIIQKASKHADDIYAASIMYTDDAINRICHIMEDANRSVQKIFRRVNTEMEEQRERVRHNQLELTGQLQDFADTEKYVKLIQEVNKQLEKERREQLTGVREKRIQNEGKSYSAAPPEIQVNQEYFERTGMSYSAQLLERRSQHEAEESLARVTGKDFAESLRRRAAREKEARLEVEDLSRTGEASGSEQLSADRGPFDSEQLSAVREPLDSEQLSAVREQLSGAGELPDSGRTSADRELEFADADFQTDAFSGEEGSLPDLTPEIQVNLDAEYFKWKEGEEEAGSRQEEKVERRGLFGKKK